MEILYSDRDLVICVKPVGLDSEIQVPQALKEDLGGEIYPIHRLDKNVGGVMVYALTQKAAAGLSRAVQERTLQKTYLAVLCGVPQQSSDVLKDLLFHDKAKNKTYVVSRQRKGVKDAGLDYQLIEQQKGRALVRVNLHTGRTHQIRVQFASRKLPLVGDGKYGGKTAEKELGLWSYALAFSHPITNQEMTFTHKPISSALWNQFSYTQEGTI